MAGYIISAMRAELRAQKREKLGKANRSSRRQGIIPAELYGHGLENIHLAVTLQDLKKAFSAVGETGIVDLVFDGERRPVLIHDLQRDYLSGEVIHVDFYQVRMDEKIKVRVPLEVVGESPAIKGGGGILNRTISELEVEALPGNLPSKFTIDISALTEVEQSFYVRDLKVPPGVTVIAPPETAILTITAPVKEEAPPAPVEVAEVKVETEEKKTERQKKDAAEEKEE